jgi:hypothetical protein
LPQFFLCKVHLAENRTFLFVVLTLNTASYFSGYLPSSKVRSGKQTYCWKSESWVLWSWFLLEKMKSGRGEHKLVKKQDLTWKSRMLLFQSPSWKAERSKECFDIFKTECWENKRDSLQSFWKEKARVREQKKWNFLNLITRQINLPNSSNA